MRVVFPGSVSSEAMAQDPVGGLLLAARQAANAANTTVVERPHAPLDLSIYPTTPLQQFGLFIIVFFPVVSVLLVGLRVYDRTKTKTFGADDAFIVAATVLAAAEGVFSYAMMRLMYLGVHAWQLPKTPYNPRNGKILNYIVVMLYNPQLSLVKSSVLFFLLRLGGHQLFLRRSIQILNWSNIALLIAVLFASIFTCVPINKYWNGDRVHGVCNNMSMQYLITSGLTVLTDILVLAIPIKIVIDLQVSRKMKMVLISLLCSGVIVTVFSILRMRSIYLLHNPPAERAADPTYQIGFVYSTVECNLAIITATIPPLHGLMRRWFPRLFSVASVKTSHYNGSHPYSGGALQTVGGSDMGLKDLKTAKRSHHTRLSSITNSEEEILGKDRVTRTTVLQMSVEPGKEGEQIQRGKFYGGNY